MKRNKFKPYVRIANGREKAESWRIAFRLAFFQDIGKPFYVLVQRGFPGLVLEVGPSRREVQGKPLPVALKHKTFNRWASDIKHHANPPILRK